jgi:uncharacterized protein (TIGR02246 family)
MKRLLLASNVVLFGLVSACTQAPATVADTREADAKAILAVEEVAMKGWAARDASQIASIYAPDATLMVPNAPTVRGPEIADAMKGMFADPNLSITFVNTKAEVARSGDLGYTVGTYAMTASDPKTKMPMAEKGRYVTVFAKQADGSWKAVSDINTPDGPTTPVPTK